MMKTGYRVCDLMTRKPIAVSPELTVGECAKLMREKNVGSLVVREGDLLRGYITEQGIIHKIIAQDKDPKNTTVRDIMITKVAAIAPNRDIYDALVMMRDLDIRQLPVLDAENNNKLVGLLTIKDVLKIQPQLFDVLVEKIELREAEKKPIFGRRDALEGTCDACGAYSRHLLELEGEFLCKACRES